MPRMAANAHPIPIPILAPWVRLDGESAFEESTIAGVVVFVGSELCPEETLVEPAPDVVVEGADVVVD